MVITCSCPLHTFPLGFCIFLQLFLSILPILNTLIILYSFFKYLTFVLIDYSHCYKLSYRVDIRKKIEEWSLIQRILYCCKNSGVYRSLIKKDKNTNFRTTVSFTIQIRFVHGIPTHFWIRNLP